MKYYLSVASYGPLHTSTLVYHLQHNNNNNDDDNNNLQQPNTTLVISKKPVKFLTNTSMESHIR